VALRRDERIALHILQEVIGFVADTIDDGTSDAMPDAIGVSAAGTSVALEVTQIGLKKRFESDSLVWGPIQELPVPGGIWPWMATVGAGFAARGFAERLIRVALLCEQNGIRSPFPTWLNPAIVKEHLDDIRWYYGQDELSLRTWDSGPSGVIQLISAGYGGAVANSPDSLVGWFNRTSSEGVFESKADKLRKSGCSERHLFLHLYAHGLPFEAYSSAAFALTLPGQAAEPPRGVTHIWFLPIDQFRDRGILRWSAAAGWIRSHHDGQWAGEDRADLD
jgi:hypothetical protein